MSTAASLTSLTSHAPLSHTFPSTLSLLTADRVTHELRHLPSLLHLTPCRLLLFWGASRLAHSLLSLRTHTFHSYDKHALAQSLHSCGVFARATHTGLELFHSHRSIAMSPGGLTGRQSCHTEAPPRCEEYTLLRLTWRCLSPMRTSLSGACHCPRFVSCRSPLLLCLIVSPLDRRTLIIDVRASQTDTHGHRFLFSELHAPITRL